MSFEVHATAELPFFHKSSSRIDLKFQGTAVKYFFLLVAKHEENLFSVKILLRYHIIDTIL